MAIARHLGKIKSITFEAKDLPYKEWAYNLDYKKLQIIPKFNDRIEKQYVPFTAFIKISAKSIQSDEPGDEIFDDKEHSSAPCAENPSAPFSQPLAQLEISQLSQPSSTTATSDPKHKGTKAGVDL